MKIDTIISSLKELNLSEYPQKEIRSLFEKLNGGLAAIVVEYQRGKSFIRARTNEIGERFENKSDYSYKPQEFNTTYQRASTPLNTMFYATVIPEKIEKGELDNMRIVGIAETIPFLRKKNKKGKNYQKISFGRWYLEKDLNLVAVLSKDTFYESSSYTRELVDNFEEFLKNTPKEISENTIKFNKFLASEFTKSEIRGDYDYMISAIFAEFILDMGYDGILYPSVRTNGNGFNIALSQDSCKKLGLYAAGECSIYKVDEKVIVGNDAIVELDGKTDSFKLTEINNDREAILNELGVNSVDELIQ